VDEITIKRASHYKDCPNCVETIEIAVSTIAAADPTATVANIVNEGDSAAVVAEKTICSENDQTQWDINSNTCVNKCDDPQRPWWNTALNECQAPSSASYESALTNTDTQAAMSIFDMMGMGISIDARPTKPVEPVTPTNSCLSTEYYSYLKNACVATTTATRVPIPVRPKKSDEQLIKEKEVEAAAVFDTIHTNFGSSVATNENTTKDIYGNSVVTSDTATGLTLSTDDAMAMWSGTGFGSGITLFTPTAPAADTAQAASDDMMKNLFGGGGGTGGMSFGGFANLFGRRL